MILTSVNESTVAIETEGGHVRRTVAGDEIWVAASGDVPEGDGVLVRLDDGLEIGVFRRGGALVAYENRCAHQGGPVCTGEILGRYEQVLAADKTVVRERFSTDETHLVCPWHGWEFDLATGECAVNRRARLTAYPVRERDGRVYVRV